jgi:cytochrome c553
VHATLNQVMRGILFINSNIIFAAQSTNPGTIKPAKEPSTATDAQLGIYGGWQAVENAGLMLAEAANLLIVPGRMCSNGKPVPVQNADWPKFVQGLREAGMATYKAAQKKSEDAILEATDAVSTACSNCHEVYRDKTPQQGGNANRCVAN